MPSEPSLFICLIRQAGPKQTTLWVQRLSIWQSICGCAGEYWEEILRLLLLDISGSNGRSDSSPSCAPWTLKNMVWEGNREDPRVLGLHSQPQ